MAGNDFVMVQLSAAGIAFAGGHPLGTSNGRRSFSFAAGVPQRVERSYEWNAYLSKMVDGGGRSLFEIVPPAPPVPVPPLPPKPTPTPADSAPSTSK